MLSIVQDLMTAYDVLCSLRAARSARAPAEAERTRTPQVVYAVPYTPAVCSLLDTVEGCALYADRRMYQLARSVYDGLPAADRRRLTISPASGTMCARADYWRQQIAAAGIPPPQSAALMVCIVHRYAVIARQRGGAQ